MYTAWLKLAEIIRICIVYIWILKPQCHAVILLQQYYSCYTLPGFPNSLQPLLDIQTHELVGFTGPEKILLAQIKLYRS